MNSIKRDSINLNLGDFARMSLYLVEKNTIVDINTKTTINQFPVVIKSVDNGINLTIFNKQGAKLHSMTSSVLSHLTVVMKVMDNKQDIYIKMELENNQDIDVSYYEYNIILFGNIRNSRGSGDWSTFNEIKYYDFSIENEVALASYCILLKKTKIKEDSHSYYLFREKLKQAGYDIDSLYNNYNYKDKNEIEQLVLNCKNKESLLHLLLGFVMYKELYMMDRDHIIVIAETIINKYIQ